MSTWDKLSMADRAKYIKLAVQNGVTSLGDIREVYNKYDEGGPTEKIGKHFSDGWMEVRARMKAMSSPSLMKELKRIHDFRGVDDETKKSARKQAYNDEYYRQLNIMEAQKREREEERERERIALQNKRDELEREKEREKEKAKLKAARVRENTSPTSKGHWIDYSFTNSTEAEDLMYTNLKVDYGDNLTHVLPYIPELEMRVNGNRVSKNQMDSLAKYAGQAGVPKEAIGLAAESAFGSAPLFNTIGALENVNNPMVQNWIKSLSDEQKKTFDRVIMNANYNRAYGGIPAAAFIRDFEYMTGGWNNGDKYEGHPLLHGFDFFDRGLYNPNLKTHTTQFYNKGMEIFKEKEVQDWWNSTGKSFYELPRTEESKKALKSYNKIYPKSYRRQHPIK